MCPLSYVISTLELMVAEDYMIVYLNGATPHRRMPGLGWLKKCYQMIDRRSDHHSCRDDIITQKHAFPLTESEAGGKEWQHKLKHV